MKNKIADERKKKKNWRYLDIMTVILVVCENQMRESGTGSRREKETSNESKDEMKSELAILRNTDSYTQLSLLLVLFLFLR